MGNSGADMRSTLFPANLSEEDGPEVQRVQRWVTCLFLTINIRNSAEKSPLPTPVAHSRFCVQAKQDYCVDGASNLKEHPRIEKFSRALWVLESLLSLLLTD